MFDFRAANVTVRGQTMVDWYTDDYFFGATALGHPRIAGLYVDDYWADAGPTEQDPYAVQDMGLSAADVAAMDHAKVAQGLGLEMEAGKRYPPNHPLMHFTETIDYAIVLQGQIDMQLDDSTVTLGPGDLIVQQATNHAWINRGTEICRIAFILISSKPL